MNPVQLSLPQKAPGEHISTRLVCSLQTQMLMMTVCCAAGVSGASTRQPSQEYVNYPGAFPSGGQASTYQLGPARALARPLLTI